MCKSVHQLLWCFVSSSVDFSFFLLNLIHGLMWFGRTISIYFGVFTSLVLSCFTYKSHGYQSISLLCSNTPIFSTLRLNLNQDTQIWIFPREIDLKGQQNIISRNQNCGVLREKPSSFSSVYLDRSRASLKIYCSSLYVDVTSNFLMQLLVIILTSREIFSY